MQRTIFNSAMFSSVGCHRVNADALHFLLSVIQDVLRFFLLGAAYVFSIPPGII